MYSHLSPSLSPSSSRTTSAERVADPLDDLNAMHAELPLNSSSRIVMQIVNPR